jgi:predicted signal transduction protein with EAL and GGDEF domain
MLRSLGCSEMQGYLFSAPKPAADVKQLLLTHREGPEAASPVHTGKRQPVARSA